MEMLDAEQFSGIAGTNIKDTFTYEVARWLVRRHPKQLSVEWDLDEQGRQMGVSLPRFLPLLADDSLVEADTPYLDWLGSAAAGAEQILPWLLQRLEDAPQTMLKKTAWYDALKINVSWSLGDSFRNPNACASQSERDVFSSPAAHPSQSGVFGGRACLCAFANPQAASAGRRRSPGHCPRRSYCPLPRTLWHNAWRFRKRGGGRCRSRRAHLPLGFAAGPALAAARVLRRNYSQEWCAHQLHRGHLTV